MFIFCAIMSNVRDIDIFAIFLQRRFKKNINRAQFCRQFLFDLSELIGSHKI